MLAKLYFILSFGYAKIPGLFLPFGAIALILDFQRIKRLIENKMTITMLMLSALFIIYMYILLYFSGNGWKKEYENIFSLSYKLIIAPYIALLISDILFKKDSFFIYYISFQCILIFIASIIEPVFQLLLLFQTDGAIAVFSEIFGVRSIGFGVFHNEGVIAILLMYMIISSLDLKRSIYFELVVYFSAFMSRLILFALPIYQIYKIGYRFAVPFLFILLAIPLFFDVSQGPASEVYEIYNNYMRGDGLYLRNMDNFQTMVVFPSTFDTWVYGDRQFFNFDGTFYQDTDIGFLRLIYFGGLPFVVLYMLINLLPLFYVRKLAPINLQVFVTGVIILANIKGLAPHPWAALAIYNYYSQKSALQYQ